MDVAHFRPEEISVKVKEREVIVEAKHEEREDELGFISRQFSRRVILPQDFDPDTVETFFSAGGKLTIKAKKPQPQQSDETKERVIPIQHVASTSSSASDAKDEKEWEKVEGDENIAANDDGDSKAMETDDKASK